MGSEMCIRDSRLAERDLARLVAKPEAERSEAENERIGTIRKHLGSFALAEEEQTIREVLEHGVPQSWAELSALCDETTNHDAGIERHAARLAEREERTRARVA